MYHANIMSFNKYYVYIEPRVNWPVLNIQYLRIIVSVCFKCNKCELLLVIV